MEPAKHEKAPDRAIQGSSFKTASPSKKNSTKKRKPPYAKRLEARLSWGHRPVFIALCVGNGCWERARNWQKRDQQAPLVLPDGNDPSAYFWPVRGELVVIDAGVGPGDETLLDLVKALLRDGAETVTIWRSWHDRKIVRYWAQEVSC